MSSLLATAAFFEAQDSVAQQGRKEKRANARTIKRRPCNKQVEALMQITADSDDEDGGGLADFTPMKPELTRVPQMSQTSGRNGGQGSTGSEISSQNIAIMRGRLEADNGTVGQFQAEPTYMSNPSNYANAHQIPATLADAQYSVARGHNGTDDNSSNMQGGQTGDLNSRLNYIIHLLEEQQNNKTSSTTEELILYSFLGVFTIFIVDSFTKVGRRYIR